jgi:hypothetical protein
MLRSAKKTGLQRTGSGHRFSGVCSVATCLRGSGLFSHLGPMMSAARAHLSPLRAAFLFALPTGMRRSVSTAAPPSADMRLADPGLCAAYAAATRPGYRKDSG